MIELNQQLAARLSGLLNYLQASYVAGDKMSNAIKGFERELFISGFLSQVFPPHYRFTGGEITDAAAHMSGQIDIVVEFPQGFSFPVFPQGPRLFLAESVAAAIEVKSNVIKQWEQVLSKARVLAQVHRRYALTALQEELAQNPTNQTAIEILMLSVKSETPEPHIPFHVVGFKGSEGIASIKDRLEPGVIDSVFVVDPPCFVSSQSTVEGINALVMFLEQLESDILNNWLRLPVIRNYSGKLLPGNSTA